MGEAGCKCPCNGIPGDPLNCGMNSPDGMEGLTLPTDRREEIS